ncbi:hypothetical protein KKE06_01760 [Candidatus Micrarchaeota archaeon]|nr:hypothetical protein [Candidatus Micrarchaeota archaeon]MBU1930071.1 hypothetical protein [Candidatus Micrarchaeota archaeon]
MNPNFSTFVSPSNPSAINTSALSEFSETNELSQRGKLFSLNQTSSAIKFAPVTATPVALKTQERNGIAEAYYTLKEAEDDVVIPSGKSASAWTGIGSKNLSSTCHGFHDLPLYFQRGDESPKEGSCAEYHENARGFYWSDVEENQAVFFESVLYRPVSKNIHLITRCENTGAQWVSPNESILSEEAFEPLLLDFTETQGTTVASLQEIVEGVKQGKICQFVSQDNQSLEFFWDRAWLLGALEGDFEHSRYELLSTPNLCS